MIYKLMIKHKQFLQFHKIQDTNWNLMNKLQCIKNKLTNHVKKFNPCPKGHYIKWQHTILRDTRKIKWDSRGKEKFIQSSNFSTSWELKVVCSNEPLKLLHQTKRPLFAFSLVQVVMAYHKEKYQQHKTIVQTYTP